MISLNCCSALSYQKSCSKATPRSNAFCWEAVQEVRKFTVPNFSFEPDCGWCACSASSETLDNSRGSKASKRSFMRHLRLERRTGDRAFWFTPTASHSVYPSCWVEIALRAWTGSLHGPLRRVYGVVRQPA